MVDVIDDHAVRGPSDEAMHRCVAQSTAAGKGVPDAGVVGCVPFVAVEPVIVIGIDGGEFGLGQGDQPGAVGGGRGSEVGTGGGRGLEVQASGAGTDHGKGAYRAGLVAAEKDPARLGKSPFAARTRLTRPFHHS
ncbi:MAG: hypothetical protein JXA82_04295 [Sedimentisphaerales bacterium]|nr:hypothetical protein [Sedimentisphaerales bacterium]